jgi:hypothetical protein
MKTRYKRIFKEEEILSFDTRQIYSGDFTIWCEENTLFEKYCIVSYYDINKDGITIYHDGYFNMVRGSIFIKSKIEKYFMSFAGSKIKKISIIKDSTTTGNTVLELHLTNGLTTVIDIP